MDKLNRKKRRIHYASAFLTFIIIAMMIGLSEPILKMKNSDDRYSAFYRTDMDVDILFLGTSHVMNAVSPMHLWHEYGLTAYNLSGPGMRIPTDYWILKKALEQTIPKLVVIDCAFLTDEKHSSNTEYDHIAFDAMPFSDTKIRAVFDLYDNNYMRMRLLFPFCVYHNRWNKLSESDFVSHENAMFGFEPLFRNKEKFWTESLISKYIPEINNYSTQYLSKIVALCREYKIEILLTYLPFDPETQYADEAAWILEFAENNNLKFLEPDELVKVINIRTDYAYDAHLNYWGAIKMTDYLGEYISENYHIMNSMGIEDPDYWMNRYGEYTVELKEIAKSFGYDEY